MVDISYMILNENMVIYIALSIALMNGHIVLIGILQGAPKVRHENPILEII